MRLRTLLAVAMMTGSAGFVGWGAFGIAGRTDQPVPVRNDTARALSSKPGLLAVAARDTAEPRGLLAPAPVPSNFGWNASLLSPHMLLPPQTAALPAIPAAPITSPRAEAKRPPSAPIAVSGARKDKPKPDRYNGSLTVAQVAHIKQKLRLTANQEEHWKPVEAILIDLAKKQARGGGRLALSPDASMNLYWVAGPLVMSLREDQKSEARNLARTMGLESVASLI
jgi:hypothetical protein